MFIETRVHEEDPRSAGEKCNLASAMHFVHWAPLERVNVVSFKTMNIRLLRSLGGNLKHADLFARDWSPTIDQTNHYSCRSPNHHDPNCGKQQLDKRHVRYGIDVQVF